MNWGLIIENRTILLGDFNAHSPYWNSACQHRHGVDGLEAIIDKYELMVNNDVTVVARPRQPPGLSIIDLTGRTTENWSSLRVDY